MTARNAHARTFTTEAIALRRMDFGEADRVLTVLTPFHGKLRLLAKGVRRPTSRMAGHLEPFVHSQIQVARGRSLDLVNQAVTIAPYRAVREDMVRAARAFHFAELVDGFLEEGDHHARVFPLLLEGLEGLERGEDRTGVIDRHFELHLLAAVGFRPELTSCVVCRAELQPVMNGYSSSLGGALCPDCFAAQPSARGIHPDALKLVRYLQRTAGVGRVSVVVPDRLLRAVEQILRDQIEFVLERRLRAADFVRRVATQ